MKETFWLASELSAAPYSFVPFYPGLIGYGESTQSPDNSTSNRVCSHQILHLGSNGRPLWFKSGLRARPSVEPHQLVDRPGSSGGQGIELEDIHALLIPQFTAFTHWFRGSGTKMADQPAWSDGDDGEDDARNRNGDEICIEKDERVEELPRVVKGSLHSMIAEARKSDERVWKWLRR